ncbi:hypothetical protein BC833DRAFT_607052, partial [Globomyces pollinis-pini]
MISTLCLIAGALAAPQVIPTLPTNLPTLPTVVGSITLSLPTNIASITVTNVPTNLPTSIPTSVVQVVTMTSSADGNYPTSSTKPKSTAVASPTQTSAGYVNGVSVCSVLGIFALVL